ncbi:MAG: hypothetical protein L0Y61_06980 [Epsilonproteobacteria bacterium]|nr:hypothetical protein [Campylobacterota bacterium]
MLSLQIKNPIVESFLVENFQNDTKKMSEFINDFIEKEIIKKDIKIAFDELETIMTQQITPNTLQNLISRISPK